jgi:hypothetical protein
MIRTCSLYEACHDLFAEYPLAAGVDPHSWMIHSMVLMLRNRDDVRFFVLSQDCSAGKPRYSLYPWRAEGVVNIAADGGDAVPDMYANAVASGIPIPPDGSLFGWRFGDAVTALVAIYAEYAPEHPQPCWSVMQLMSIPEEQWPPFTGERFFGHWFWEHHRVGSIVSLGGLIAGTPDTVFWADTEAILGSGCCVVARDIRTPEGYTLRRGRYVYVEALWAGKSVPSLDKLLNDYDKTDLASRF